MHSKIPHSKWERAIHIPPIKIQRMFITTDRQPGSWGMFTTLFPKGHRDKTPSLNA